jgi:aminomuconate-semialdehyde/2-hydroxymuconate-6-semialdehyde dehydrogenase
MADAQGVCNINVKDISMTRPNTTIANFIDGEMLSPLNGQYIDNIEPATGDVYALVPDSDEKDLELAVKAAKVAFPAWRDTPIEKRAEILNKLADLIEANQDEFITAEAIDNGKTVAAATAADIPRSIFNLRAFAKSAVSFGGKTSANDVSSSYILNQPMGVVSIISPWNFPLVLFTWKVAPALMAGNCVIAKPSEITPMTAYLLSKLANEAGVPKGVLNVLHGRGAQIGSAITNHSDIPAISFTGGTVTGLAIYKDAALQLKKVSLELGGKNPTIVFDDADLEKAVEGAKNAAFANQGQVCLCGSRLFVQEGIYEKFKTALVEKAKEIKIGDPLEKETEHGATVSKEHMEKVLGYIDLAKEEGGTILTGGKRHTVEGRCENGYFIEPTVIDNLPYTCRTNQEEIFGPVVSIMPFKNEEDVLEMANSTQYGLASSVWTEDNAKAKRMAEKIESGIVWINCWNLRDVDTPFGGVKKSGLGREGTWDAMHFFTQQKTVTTPKGAA